MYRYKLRPQFKGDKLLIEFPDVPKQDVFITDLMNSIALLNPKKTGSSDLWMNDELVYYFETLFGNFELSVDIWDIGFIMSDNEGLILMIDSRLQSSPIFEKEEVNFENY